jgi:type II secretory pathway pseudopilin PulG
MSRPRRFHGEGGATLAEILVAVAILGVLIVGILGAMAASIRASDIHRKLSTAETRVRSGAEAIKDRSVVYDVGGAGYAAALPAGVSLGTIECWDGTVTMSGGAASPNFGGCGADHGMQRITVTASSGSATESLRFIKRRS